MTPAEEAGRAAQALELRKAGVGYAVIAERLRFDGEDEARAAVVPLLAEAIADQDREQVALERLRLDGMLTGLHTKARSGDVRAVEQTLRIQERLRLLALSGGGYDGTGPDA